MMFKDGFVFRNSSSNYSILASTITFFSEIIITFVKEQTTI